MVWTGWTSHKRCARYFTRDEAKTTVFIQAFRSCGMTNRRMAAPSAVSVGCTPKVCDAVETLRGIALNTALLVVFGSQARGDAGPDSDLDILYVEGRRDQFEEIDNAVRRSGVESTIIPHTRTSLRREMNLYGRMEYWAMREGVVIHADTKSKSMLRCLVQYDSDTVRACAPQWMRVARSCFRQASSYERRGGRHNGFRCFMSYFAVTSMLKAVLTHNGLLFPFTRTLWPLYDMLPDVSILDNVCDVNTVQSWERYQDRKYNVTRLDALKTTKLAKLIYAKTNDVICGESKQDKTSVVH